MMFHFDSFSSKSLIRPVPYKFPIIFYLHGQSFYNKIFNLKMCLLFVSKCSLNMYAGFQFDTIDLKQTSKKQTVYKKCYSTFPVIKIDYFQVSYVNLHIQKCDVSFLCLLNYTIFNDPSECYNYWTLVISFYIYIYIYHHISP